MTYPGQDGQWQQPYGGDQPYGNPQQPYQQQGGGQYGAGPQQPYQQQPQQPYQQQQPPQGYYPPQQGDYNQQPPTGGFGAQTPPPPPAKGKRGLIIGLVVALVALIGGGATWWALSQSNSVAAGAETPSAAAMNLANSIGNGDIVGVLSTLAPAEAALFTDPIEEASKELKRLQVLSPDADPKALSGVQLKTENLVFDDAQAQKVNDHLTITKLTGGTLTITADMSKLPFAKEFLDAAMPGSAQRQLEKGPQTKTIDIGEQVRRSGEPVRIATVNVDGEWYPSLMYSIADYALLDEHEEWPQDSIPANGANSANEAVRQIVQAGLDENVRRVIELLPPDEMGVLHDAGPAILKAAEGDADPSGAKITQLETKDTPVDGGTRATLTKLEVQTPNGETFSASKDGDCYAATFRGESKRFCADELIDELSSSTRHIPSEVKQVLRSLATGVMGQGLGVITTEVAGKHYVSPIRTVVEQGMTVLRSLQPEDVKALLRLAE